ncbi:hypothetical protein [Legionella sp. WA2022007384]
MINWSKFKSFFLSFIGLSSTLFTPDIYAANKSLFQNIGQLPTSVISTTPGNNSLPLTQTITNEALHYSLKIPAGWSYKRNNQDLQIFDAEKMPMIFIVAINDTEPSGTKQKLDDLFNHYSPEKAAFIQEIVGSSAPSYKLIKEGMLTKPSVNGPLKGYFFIMEATMYNHNVQFANLLIQRPSEPRYLIFTYLYRLEQKSPQNIDTELAIFQSWTL